MPRELTLKTRNRKIFKIVRKRDQRGILYYEQLMQNQMPKIISFQMFNQELLS